MGRFRIKALKTKAAILAAVLLAACLSGCSSCTVGGGDEPSPTPAPQVTYTTTHMIKYWPEEASYETCDYSCVVEIPKFAETFTAGYAMNKAVSEYLLDLDGRIESDYLKNSTAAHPHTEVTLGVEYVPGCTNVIFTEEHAYSDTPYIRTHVLMLNDYGYEQNLCDVFLDYHAAERAAGLISEKAGVDYMTALAAIDINHGAKATLAGCTVYARDGVLSPAGEGEKRFDLSFGELSPASSFDGVSYKEFVSLSRLLRFVSDAAAVRQENIADGKLSAFEASSFMGEYCLSLGKAPEAGRVNIPEKEFESYYRSTFGNDFPGVDTDGFDIKHEDGYYRVLYSPKPYEYHVDMLDVRETGGVFTVTGDLLFGAYGYAFSEYVCHVTVTLVKSSESPFGFRLVGYEMSI